MRTCDFCGRSGVYSVTYKLIEGNESETTTANVPETEGKLRIYNVGLENHSRDVCPDCYYEMYKMDIRK